METDYIIPVEEEIVTPVKEEIVTKVSFAPTSPAPSPPTCATPKSPVPSSSPTPHSRTPPSSPPQSDEEMEEEEDEAEAPAVAATKKLTMQEVVGVLDAMAEFLESPTADTNTLLTQVRDVRAKCDSVLIVKRREVVKKRRVCNHYVHVYMGLYNGAYIFRFDKNIYTNPPPVREQLLNKIACRTRLILSVNTGPKEDKVSDVLVKKLQQEASLYSFVYLPRKYKCANNNCVKKTLNAFDRICDKYNVVTRNENIMNRVINKFNARVDDV